MSTRMNGHDERICMFVMMLRRNSPKIVSDTRICDCAAELIKSAKILHRAANIACEREHTEKENKAGLLAQTRANCALMELWALADFPADRKGPLILFNNGDPRGSSIKLYPPDGSYNSWDGESYGVPIE